MGKKASVALFLMGFLLVGCYFAERDTRSASVAVADAFKTVEPTSNHAERDRPTDEVATREADAPQLEDPVSRISEAMTLLNENARQAYKNTWLHIKEEIVFDVDVPNNGVLPNGEIIPLHQVNDIWYQVNEKGEVIATLTIMHDTKGHIVQVGVCNKGVSWNSVTKERGSCQPMPLSLDGGFQHEMEWLISKGAMVEQESQVLLPSSGKVGYQVVLSQSWSTPWRGDAYGKGITRAVEKAVFDLQGGHLVEWQTIFRFEDGTGRVYRRITWEVSQNAPPPEARKFLEALP